MEIDHKFLTDIICSLVSSIISLTGILTTLFYQRYGNLVLFWVSFIIWSIILMISVVFLILVIHEHKKWI